jgi:hypothetical protein
MLLFLYLMHEILADPELRKLGRYGVFTISALRVADAGTSISPAYAKDVRESPRRFDMKYGVIGEDKNIPAAGNQPKKKKKESQPNMVDMLYARRPVVPKTHVNIYVGMEMKPYGLDMRDSMTVNVNRPIVKSLAYLRKLYLAQHNWKRIKPKNDNGYSRSIGRDSSVFDFKDPGIDQKYCKDKFWEILSCNEKTNCVRVGIRPSALMTWGVSVGKHPVEHPDKTLKMDHVFDRVDASIFMENFIPDEDKYPDIIYGIVYGPYPYADLRKLEDKVQQSQEAKKRLEIDTLYSTVKALTLEDFPVEGLALHPSIERHRPACFVIHIPHQHRGALHTIREVYDWLKEKELLRTLGDVIIPPERLIPIHCYIQMFAAASETAFVNGRSGDIYAKVYMSLDLFTTPETNHRVRVRAKTLRLSVVIDDIGDGPCCAEIRRATDAGIKKLDEHLTKRGNPGMVYDRFLELRLKVVE